MQYIFDNKTISDLSYSEIARISSEAMETGQNGFFDIHPQHIEVDSGAFTHPGAMRFPVVTVAQTDRSLIVSCPCATSGKQLCAHQSQVLFNIVDRTYLRIFFDPVLRQNKMQQVAKDYGMESMPHLDDFFQVEYTNKSFAIQPKVKELFPFTPDTDAYLKEHLLPQKKVKTPAVSEAENTATIMVLRKHKYHDQLMIELLQGSMSRDGKIKNPLTAIDPLTLIWKTAAIAETKFYTAVAAFQQPATTTKTESEIAALKVIVKNPFQLPVFYHDAKISENITANAIIPVQLQTGKTDIQLSVQQKGPFYEVSGTLEIKSKTYNLHELKIRYGYFLLLDDTLYLLVNPDVLRVIDFFKKNNHNLLIHSSIFESFRQNILEKLEHRVSVKYNYIKPATEKQIKEQGFDQKNEQLIYLSDEAPHIAIIPVIRYGDVEIPVFSKKQIYTTDQKGKIFTVKRDDDLEIRFTSLIAGQHPDFEEQLQEKEFFYLHKEKFLDEQWFLNAFETWENNHIRVLGFQELRNNQLNPHKGKVTVRINSGIDWFNTALTVQYGKQKASLKQLHQSIRNKSKFVRLDDGSLGILPEEWLQKFADYFQAGEVTGEWIKIPKNNFTTISSLTDNGELSPEVKVELAMLHQRLNSFENIQETTVPDGLLANLRDYQKQGLNWLNCLDEFNFGACLADDMGLGKTIQIIAFILLQRTKQPQNTNLVVVPTSLLFNWQDEVAKFAPSIKIFTHHGAAKLKDIKSLNEYEIILTTYGTLLSDLQFLKKYRFNYIILDESQNIKNPDSQRYKAACSLHSRNKIVLTGTPVENNTFDIYGQFSFACPGLLGNKLYFKDTYAIPIDRFEDHTRALFLQQKIKPFILRRTKAQVAPELPEKTEMVLYCEMGPEQRAVYNRYEKELREYISATTDEDLPKTGLHVLTGLTKLRQICNSPALLKAEDSVYAAKIEVLMEQIENKSHLHKILVFSQFVSMLDLIKKELESRNISFEYLTGQTTNRASKVNEFQQNDDVRVFLISLKAGGTGLNLTEADYVYLVDPWWNPAVENQAIDRCYRIGQKKNVIAVRLICPDTIEEKIMKLQESKTQLADQLIKTDTSIFKSLTKKDLLAMLE